MSIRSSRFGNKCEDHPTDRETLQLLIERVRRVHLAQLSQSDDPLAASLAQLTTAVHRLLDELQRERRS